MAEFTTKNGSVSLAGDDAGRGPPVVLLHGLTATRRYVVMGSRSLERAGHRVIAYDARGHGVSAPAPEPDAYAYGVLVEDLRAVMDDRGIDRAVLAGVSMGAHTLLAFALSHPDRVAALAVITPAFDPEDDRGAHLDRWDRLAEGLRARGAEGFMEAYDVAAAPERWQETIERVLRQRMGAHEHPEAVADALSALPRSRPFESWADLGSLDVPALVVASRDEADPGHPLAVGERYATAIPGAALRTEEEGASPLAWQGGQLSRVLAELASRAA